MTRKMVAGVGLALLLGGCLNSADTAKVDATEAQFFTQWQAKQYGAIYDGAASDLTSAASKDDFIAMMTTLDQRMGACQPPVKAMDYKFNTDDKGYLGTQGWSATCANGKLDLTVSVILRDGVAKLDGIHFKSPALEGGGDQGATNAPAAGGPPADNTTAPPASGAGDSGATNSQ
jgi:hypothetical protein